MDKNIAEAADLERILQQQNAVRDVLIKTPEARDPWDIDLLHEFVMRNSNTYRLFQGAQEIICKTICRELTLLELPRNALVCKQGEFGDTFYIIFSGRVSIYVETRCRLSCDEDGTWQSGNFQTLDIDDSARMDVLCKKFGAWKNTIERGGTFGEVAVSDPTAKRTGTVICDTPVALICLKRGAYQRLLRITNSSELKFTEVEFLKTLFLFRNWPHAGLTRLSRQLKRTNFPAATFLTRVGAEASVLYFIYDGLVQESVPVVHYCDANGLIKKCMTTEDYSKKQSGLQVLPHSLDMSRYRKAHLELTLYQEHDICAELPFYLSKATYQTNLLAMNHVKALAMDRQTWKELFQFRGSQYIRDAYQLIRSLAETREDWRQTRLKLALANPRLTLTISTMDMMQDGHCVCGWCGSQDHSTGNSRCMVMQESKRKEAGRAQIQYNKSIENAQFQSSVNRSASLSFAKGAQLVSTWMRLNSKVPSTVDDHTSDKPNSNSITTLPNVTLPSQQPLIYERSSPLQEVDQKKHDDTLAELEALTATSKPHSTPLIERRIVDRSDQNSSLSTSLTEVVDAQTEEIRVGTFTEGIAAEYRSVMLKKMKRVTSMEQYLKTRRDMLAVISQNSYAPEFERRFEAKLKLMPSKPKIPRQTRRFISKTSRDPGPNRFNRKINRMLRKIQGNGHAAPTIEESLQDIASYSA